METPSALSRNQIVDAIFGFISSEDLLTAQEIRTALEREIDAAGPDAVLALKARLAEDNGWDYHQRDPLARAIHHRLADRFLAEGSELRGIDRLVSLATNPVVLFPNHLSYADANVIEVLLHRSAATDLADRLTALAGPKVFTSRERRFSSLCFGTVKVPQSTEVSSEEAALNARDVARAARRSIDVARARLGSGDALLLFGEGTRSRSCRMQPLLPGVARYLDVPDAWAVPIGLTGSEELFPVNDSRPRPARVMMEIGSPIRARDLLTHSRGDRRVVVDAIGLAVAELLPAAYRGSYGETDRCPEALQLLRKCRRTR